MKKGKFKDNLEGRKFGEFTVLKFSHQNKKGLAYYDCICSCGKEKKVRGANLVCGKSKSCGCINYKNLRPNPPKRRLDFIESSSRYVYGYYKSGARVRKLEFSISLEYLKEIINKNCYYCGRPPSNVYYHPFYDKKFLYNGVDRVDNSKGYVEGNCVPCCKTCNLGKSNLSKDEFLEWVYRIYKYQTLAI